MVRYGRLELDKYHYLDQPEAMVEELKKCGTRIDLFTFLQKVDETTPKYKYPMEWDNLAVLPVTTFENWWTNQISSLPRNRARQAEKRGVTLREVAFDEALVKGIWEMYNESPIRQGAAFKHYGKSLEEVRRMSATYLESSVFIGAYLGEKLIGFVKLVADQTWSQAKGANKCPDRTLGEGLRGARHSASCLSEFSVWKQKERRVEQFQGSEWIQASGCSEILRATDSSGSGGIPDGVASPVGGSFAEVRGEQTLEVAQGLDQPKSSAGAGSPPGNPINARNLRSDYHDAARVGGSAVAADDGNAAP